MGVFVYSFPMDQKIDSVKFKEFFARSIISQNDSLRVNFAHTDRQTIAGYFLKNFNSSGEEMARSFLRFSDNFKKMDWKDLRKNVNGTKPFPNRILKILEKNGFNLNDLGNNKRTGQDQEVAGQVKSESDSAFKRAESYLNGIY